MHHRGAHIRTPRLLIAALTISAGALLVSAAGCYQPDGYGYGYTTPSAVVTTPQVEVSAGAPGAAIEASSYTPNLVAINPSVQVLADYEEPIFFTGGAYWRETNGGWYSSPSYSGDLGESGSY